jgi:potassium voltage-gated channel Eag-related subfamily H protein 7
MSNKKVNPISPSEETPANTKLHRNGKESKKKSITDGQPKRTTGRASALFSEQDFSDVDGLLQTHLPAKLGCLIAPTAIWFVKWQFLVALLLIFTAIVTPFEVAFLETKVDALFWVNRMVDMCFLADMAFAFVLPIQVQTQNGQKWVTRHKDLAMIYFKGWFAIDVVAVFPFDIITVCSKSDTGDLKVLRIIRCLRLAKLVKLGKGSAVLKAFIRKNGIRNSTLKLLKFAVLICCVNHWLACLWMLVPKIEAAESDWVTKYYGVDKINGTYMTPNENDELVYDSSYHGSWKMYLTCAYWAMMTLSTIGYGDVTPATETELLTGIIGMGVGASIYAYAVGGICGILSSRDPISAAFHDSLECLHNLTSEYNLPPAFKLELHDFVWRSNFLFREKSYREFFHLLSPGLQDFLVSYLHKDWIQKVAIFKGLPTAQRGRFLARIAMAMESKAYPMSEWLFRPGDPIDCMTIVKFGLLTSTTGKKTIMLNKGTAFGTEILLGRGSVRSKAAIKAITYTVVSFLTAESVAEILQHPSLNRITGHLRRLARWSVVRLSFVHYVRIFKKMHGTTLNPESKVRRNVFMPIAARCCYCPLLPFDWKQPTARSRMPLSQTSSHRRHQHTKPTTLRSMGRGLSSLQRRLPPLLSGAAVDAVVLSLAPALRPTSLWCYRSVVITQLRYHTQWPPNHWPLTISR